MFNSFKFSTYFSAQPGVPKIELSMQFRIPGTRLASAWIVQKHPNSSHKPTALFARNAPRVDRRVTFAMVTVNADPYGMPQGATTTQLG